MNKNTRNIVITGFCIALGLVLPMAFHAIPNAGSVMLPMHIPVLLCGLVTGPVTGLICGIFTPFLSRSAARFRGVCPPNCAITPSGFSFL